MTAIEENMRNYEYQLAVTDKFIARVFAADPRYQEAYGGMVSAHGDKVEQYRDYWEDKGLDFNRASVIYFLTYTKKMYGPKHKSKEWVISNYSHYWPILEEIEAEINNQWPIDPGKYVREHWERFLKCSIFDADIAQRYTSLVYRGIEPISYTDWKRIHPALNTNHGYILYLLGCTRLRTRSENRYLWIQRNAEQYVPVLLELERKFPYPK
jgi:hypothetical protein